MKSIRTLAILAVLVSAIMVAPALAGTKYTGGSPNLTASVSGSNDFSAGTEIVLPVVIENSGLNQFKQVSSATITPADLPNTAKFVTVTMSAGTAPVVIESDPQMIGDIAGQERTTVLFSVKVNPDAPAGTYQIPLAINYSVFSSVEENFATTMKYTYSPQDVVLSVPLVIKAEVVPEVLDTGSQNLVAGADGYLNLTLRNAGSLDGSKATVEILRDGDSPIEPVDNSVYIGDFPAGSTVTCQYKVTVDPAADNKSFPFDVVVVYQNAEGDTVNSRTETAGAMVGNKVDFVILSPPVTMSPGSKKLIQVTYKNTGDSTIRSATARISYGDPFTSSDSVAYLGDLAPGQSAVASYQISVKSSATIKMYGIDSEVRYNDAMGDTYISRPVKISVDVKNLTGVEGILANPVILSLIFAAIIGILYAGWFFWRRSR